VIVRRGTLLTGGVLVVALVAFALPGCSKRQVTRIDPDTTVDLSGRWNDTDSRLVAEEMIADATARPWLASFMRDEGRNPVIIAGSVKNRSHEHINTRTFLKDIQRALLNSGTIDLVADAGEREEVRDEKLDQLANADPATIARMGMEQGADYMMHGEVNTIVDQEDGERVVYYQVNLQLTDIESNRLVWIGEKKIKKYIGKGKFGA
jgi:uncharacterized protein (TIGR02722 family)